MKIEENGGSDIEMQQHSTLMFNWSMLVSISGSD